MASRSELSKDAGIEDGKDEEGKREEKSRGGKEDWQG